MSGAFDGDLEGLLAALRLEGFPLGVREAIWLRQAFAGAPRPAVSEAQSTDALRLRAILFAVVVKAREDRARFDRIFDTWWAGVRRAARDAGVEARQETAAAPPTSTAPAAPSSASGRIWRVAALVGALTVLALIAGLLLRPDGNGPHPPPGASPEAGVREGPAGAGPERPGGVLERPETFRTAVPEIIVDAVSTVRWSAYGPTAAALALALVLWLALRRRSYRPKSAPLPTRRGPPRLIPRAPYIPGQILLDRVDEEQLTEGIGRFMAEQPTPQLDVRRTIAATARAAGLPQIHFERARFDREVWLWVDEAAVDRDPLVQRLAGEMECLLRSSGLPVERAWFRGVPDRLVHEDGAGFEAAAIDERRDAAVVAVLTDGRLLARRSRAETERGRLRSLLRIFMNWPRLVFVDVSRGAHGLADVLAPFELEVVPPEQAAAALGGAARAAGGRGGGGGASGDLRLWAAARALSHEAVPDTTAFALRERLGLAVSAWDVHRLPTQPSAPRERVTLLRWLHGSQSLPADGVVPPDSLLGRALAFWRDRLDDEERRARAAVGADVWVQQPGERHLRMQRALLGLWDAASVDEAAWELGRLAPSGLNATIRERLAALVPAEWADHDHVVPLPWRWSDRPAAIRVLLRDLGLAGAAGLLPAESLRRPGRLWLALALCLGLAVGGVAALAWPGQGGTPRAPDVTQVDAPDDGWVWWGVADDGGSIPVEAVSPRAFSSARTAADGVVEVRWVQRKTRCTDRLSDDTLVWRCGTRPPPERPGRDWPRLSVATLVALDTDPEAQALASAMLDSGSADAVIFVTDSSRVALGRLGWAVPAAHQELVVVHPARDASLRGMAERIESERFGPEGTWEPAESSLHGGPPKTFGARAAVVSAKEWRRLARDLEELDGQRSATDVWADADTDVATIDPAAPVLLRKDWEWCPYEEMKVKGVSFVRVCGGTFRMGSEDDDPEAVQNERPAHDVRLSPFWIGKHEVSNAQFRMYRAEHDGADDLPASWVSWHDAKGFCESLGGQLPTEAEWEYAARGRDGRRYPWGDEPPDERRAVFRHGRVGDPSPVDSHPAGRGPFGTHHQAGNVWEWVADCYRGYGSHRRSNDSSALPDPLVDSAHCEERVVRGGSYWVGARRVRSAYRVGYSPELRGPNFGFRCVRLFRHRPLGKTTRADAMRPIPVRLPARSS